MYINKINQSPMNFRGHVSSNVVNFITSAAKNEAEHLALEAAKNKKNVNVHLLKDLKNLSKDTISKLSDYMLKMHKDTVLDIRDTKYGKAFIYRNKNFSKNNFIDASYVRTFKDPEPITDEYKYQKGYIPSKVDITQLWSYIDSIERTVNPEGVDKELLNAEIDDISQNASSRIWINNYFAKQKAKKLQKTAKEIDKSIDLITIANNKSKETEEIKMREKRNLRTVTTILEG